MKLRYLGHACFLITSAAGRKLLMDPFDPAIGYPVPRERVDVVTASHAHHDHNYTDELPDGYARIDTAGRHAQSGFAITGLNSFHDAEQGKKRGKNILYLVEVDGLRIAHLGDLGHMPDADTLDEVRNIDVLLLPVGGYFTIDAKTAVALMRAVSPALTIPMHYQTGANDLPIAPVAEFARTTGARYADAQEIEIGKEDIAGLSGVLVLRHPA